MRDEPGFSPPPIRYPLPTLVVGLAALALLWWGGDWIRGGIAALVSPLKRVVRGPDYPASERPRVLAGPIVRRVLLLKDDVPLRSRPNLAPTETLRRRGFYDLYDAWPTTGPADWLRIGNDKLVGWVEASSVLPWDTRLVLLPAGGPLALRESAGGGATTPIDPTTSALPVIGWTDGAVEVAVWEGGQPWAKVARTGWVSSDSFSSDRWAVLLSDAERTALRRAERAATTDEDRLRIRLRAVLGTLLGADPLSASDLQAARSALPTVIWQRPTAGATATSQPSALYEAPESEASWGGSTFRVLPVSALP